MSEKEILPGDIVEVIVNQSVAGLPIGIHAGIVVDLKDQGKSIAFTDKALALRAKGMGVGQFLPVASWKECEVVRVIKGTEHR